jgi:Nucleotide-diphospho-sugar transferase
VSRYRQRQRFDCDLNNNQQTIEQGLRQLPAMLRHEPFIDCNSSHLSLSGADDIQCGISLDMSFVPTLELVNTKEFDKFRSDRLASMDYSEGSIILHQNQYENCLELQTHAVNDGSCFAVVRVEAMTLASSRSTSMYNIIHYDADISDEGIDLRDKTFKKLPQNTYRHFPNEHNIGIKLPSGLFRKVPKWKGRARIKEKLTTFIAYFHDREGGILDQLRNKLSANNIKAGDDLIVMVVNEGEIDLFMNFACSCQMHDISLNKLIVFSASIEIVHLIEATGAMALFHEGYGVASKKASSDYLDRIFVDMMWYKAFSIYLILREGINILFQDVDLVWFRDPFPYFHDYISQHKAQSDASGIPCILNASIFN